MSKVMVIAIGAGLLLISAAAAADTYRWVDADGNVHYSDRPTRGAAEVDIKSAGDAPAAAPAPTPADTQDSEITDDSGVEEDAGGEAETGEAGAVDEATAEPGTTNEAGATDDAAQVRAQLCSQAQERLANYEKADGIYEEGPEGRRQLSVQERVDVILKARQSVKDLCEEPVSAEASSATE